MEIFGSKALGHVNSDSSHKLRSQCISLIRLGDPRNEVGVHGGPVLPSYASFICLF